MVRTTFRIVKVCHPKNAEHNPIKHSGKAVWKGWASALVLIVDCKVRKYVGKEMLWTGNLIALVTYGTHTGDMRIGNPNKYSGGLDTITSSSWACPEFQIDYLTSVEFCSILVEECKLTGLIKHFDWEKSRSSLSGESAKRFVQSCIMNGYVQLASEELVRRQPSYRRQSLSGPYLELSTITRLPFEEGTALSLAPCFHVCYIGDIQNAYQMKNDERMRLYEIPFRTLRAAYMLLLEKPWVLCGPRNALLHRLPCLSRAKLRRWVKIKRLETEVSDVVEMALHVKEWISQERESGGHTIFTPLWGKVTYGRFEKMGKVELFEPALQWCVDNGLIVKVDSKAGILSAETPFIKSAALGVEKDVKRAVRSAQRLRMICERGRSAPLPQFNINWKIPSIPSGDLTGDQLKALIHVIYNPITMIEGPPGTGKTEVIRWIAGLTRVLVLSFTGMMVSTLAEKLGGHTEMVYTIHYLDTMYEHNKRAMREWFGLFDVVVVDEASNISEALLGKLLRLIYSSCTRLVFVFDRHQIKPIEPGTMLELPDLLPEHTIRLTEQKRVAKDSIKLAEASVKIAEGRVEDIEWYDSYTDGPVVLRQPGSSGLNPLSISKVMDEYLNSYLTKNGKGLRFSELHWQCIALTNKTCEVVNKHVLTWLVQKERLDNHTRVKLTDDLTVYIGMKIVFTKTYKDKYKHRTVTEKRGKKRVTRKVKSKDEILYHSVRNGELAVIDDITIANDVEFIRSGTKGTEDADARCAVYYRLHLADGRKVLLSKTHHVDPETIKLGYCITSNSSQGSQWKSGVVFVRSAKHSVSVEGEKTNRIETWDREFFYVMISRFQKNVFVHARKSDIEAICMKKANHRHTALGLAIQHMLPFFKLVDNPDHHEDEDGPQSIPNRRRLSKFGTEKVTVSAKEFVTKWNAKKKTKRRKKK